MNNRTAGILNGLLTTFSNIVILLMTLSFILAFVNYHAEYISTLSIPMLFSIPFGILILALRILSMDWSPFRFAKDDVKQEVNK